MINLTDLSSINFLADDNVIKRLIRQLDEPMCYFGEGPTQRRERLKEYLKKLKPEELAKLQQSVISKPANLTTQNGLEQNDKVSYHKGSDALREARLRIANYSIRRSSERLDLTRMRQLELEVGLEPKAKGLERKQEVIEAVRQIEDLGSYVDEDNPSTGLKTITSSSLNPHGTLLATSTRSGRCKLWSVPDMETYLSFKPHAINANFITFNPKSGQDLSQEAANLASCAMDGSILMWNLVDESAHCQLSSAGQSWHVTRIRYHPSGEYLAACCSDKSWRLWDLESKTEIIRQEGHSEAVFDIAFHSDGSLAASAGLDSYARVWDLRTGKSIQLLEGHIAGLRTIDFSPDGYHLATGGLDNSVKIWNLRQRKLEYTIPAHLNAVTSVMFEKSNGFYLVTSSFDKTVKFWSSQTWAPIKTLEAYDDKVSNMDLSVNNRYLATCYSKYIKLWTIN